MKFGSWKLQNEPFLRDLHFKLWKSSTSKAQQFFKTSSTFGVDNMKNEAILRDFLQKWKVECRAGGLVPMHSVIFLFCLNYCACHEKVRPGHMKCCTWSCKITLANPKIWCSKMQLLSGNQRPDLPTSLMKMSLVLRLPRDMHLCRSSSNLPRLPVFEIATKTVTFCSLCGKVQNPLRVPRNKKTLLGHKTLEKQHVSRLFSFFAPWIFFFLTLFSGPSFFSLSLLWLFHPLLFHLSILSEIWHPNSLPSWSGGLDICSSVVLQEECDSRRLDPAGKAWHLKTTVSDSCAKVDSDRQTFFFQKKCNPLKNDR